MALMTFAVSKLLGVTDTEPTSEADDLKRLFELRVELCRDCKEAFRLLDI
jgi:hypothetical protein